MCESAHKWPPGAGGGEVMAATSGNTCSSQMSRCCTVPGAIQGHGEWAWLRARVGGGTGGVGGGGSGDWHNSKAKATKVRVQGSAHGAKNCSHF